VTLTYREQPSQIKFVARRRAGNFVYASMTANPWRNENRKLRSILLDCGLDEALKWGKPCFMFQGRNVAIIQPFKQHLPVGAYVKKRSYSHITAYS
jgi:uncharacterized protein YdeI (YjbR/CyaY-like superfamily)